MLNNSNSSSKNHNGASNNCSTGSSGRNASAAAAERERDSVVEIRRGRGGGGGGGGGNGHGRSSRDEAAGGGSSSSNNATSSNTGAPCGACKFLRRKCVSDCVFAPYFGTDQGAAKFAAVHKVFGASNVSKLLLHQVPVHRRHEAVFSICYEAQARLQDPIFGCVSQIFSLNQQIQALQAELRVVQEQMNAMQQQHHHNLAMNMNMGMNFLQSPHQQQHLLYGDMAAMNMNLHNPNMGCSSSSPALRIISDNRDLQSMNMNLHNPNMASSSSSGGGLRIMSGQSPPTAPYPRLNIRDTPIATAAAAQSSPIIPFDMDLSASPLENLHRQHRGGVGIANEDEDAPTSSEDPAAELAFAHSFFHPRK